MLLQNSFAFLSLMVIYAFILVVTELLWNAAAMALVLTIAAAVAMGLGQPSLLFFTADMIAASQTFLRPIDY